MFKSGSLSPLFRLRWISDDILKSNLYRNKEHSQGFTNNLFLTTVSTKDALLPCKGEGRKKKKLDCILNKPKSEKWIDNYLILILKIQEYYPRLQCDVYDGLSLVWETQDTAGSWQDRGTENDQYPKKLWQHVDLLNLVHLCDMKQNADFCIYVTQ